MKKYICTGFSLGPNWASIILNFAEGKDIFTKELPLPRNPFRSGDFKGFVVNRIATAATDLLYGPVLAGEALAVPMYRTQVTDLARQFDRDALTMYDAMAQIENVFRQFRENISADALAAYNCYRSVVKQMNSFADGIATDDTIHRDPSPEEVAKRKAAKEAKKRSRVSEIVDNIKTAAV